MAVVFSHISLVFSILNPDDNLFIDTMKGEIEKIVFKKIEPIYQVGSCKNALPGYFPVSSFNPREPNKILDNRVANYNLQNVD